MEEKKHAGRWLFDLIESIGTAVVLAVLLLSFLTPTARVVGESMRETLQDGDVLLLVRPWIAGEIEYGDIVVVREESFSSEPIIKRVIATGGETVEIDFETGLVTVDGRILAEPYIRDLTTLAEGTEFPYTVPEGSLFLMGDNRNNSSDSRSSSLGAVSEEKLIGRAVFLIFPGVNAEDNQRDIHRIGVIHRLSEENNAD